MARWQLEPLTVRIRHFIIDRDGVLNREDPAGGWVRTWAEWRWEQGALEGLRIITAAGAYVSVVTNQSCIGRGKVPAAAIAAVHERMRQAARTAGARIDTVWVCPHCPEDRCDCRKPRPGLVRQAIESSGVPESQTLLVGDALRDLEAGLACGLQVVLVRTGKGAATEGRLADGRVPVYDNLQSAAAGLLIAR